ncbi:MULTISPECIES: hypothetical protein [unclassified Methanosarcina]|uniref:hypothetical protein n=1 Tax=unclassified Methanosarcina TaxID=2644672 RepID=UPI0006154430|nr:MULTISPECIES: hypothetical protein [unclassified Methanosarcina]AKB17683.1 hypothetical protein MSWHS_0820 [Methanosarcina sp. WWM596]AKB21039.1 hypothetical protein MSWH1_0768 [Methanosarcina sp. WH1]
MKRKDSATKNQKYLAIFLAATMFLSAFLIYFTATGNNNNDVPTPETGEEPITVPFSQVQGKQVHHEFNSIINGLEMSPDGVTNAVYVDFQKTERTPLEAVFGNMQTMNVSFSYGSDVTKRYGASYGNESGFELHQIPEQKISMPANTRVMPYEGYQILDRTNGTYNIWNVVGSPAIIGPIQTVASVIDILEGNATSTTEYDQILSQADPEGSIYQEVVKRTNTSDIPAKQYYRDLKKLDDGSYTQTSIYLDPEPEVNEKIKAYQANSSERGVAYNVTTLDNITKLVISSDFESLYNESALLSI